MKVTVGIPAYNEGKSIGLTLGSILYQITEFDEVIVVSSGSTDNTEEEVMSFIKANPELDIKLIVEKKTNGKASAINIINEMAKGDIIVQTDADCVVCTDAIENLAKHFDNAKVGAVSGYPLPVIGKENVFYDWTKMSYRKMHEIRLKENEAGTFWHLSGYLLAWRKGALPELPFIKGAVDAWMGKLIIENNYSIEYEPDANVMVTAPKNIKDFITQKARVRAGYYLLPKDGMPRTVKRELLFLPKEFMCTPFWRWHKFIISGLVYGYTWYKGKKMAQQNKSLEEIWKVPMSTK